MLLLAAGCKPTEGDVALSRNDEQPEIPSVPVPAPDGPRLAAIAHTAPVREAPDKRSKIIGYLHAGASVARAATPYSTEQCAEGWYPVRPRGFVCVEEGATLDLNHPTLTAMAIQPDLDADMPYAYARIKTDTTVFEVEEDQPRSVRAGRALTSQSGAAVVGSWEAGDQDGKTRRLAMLTNGQFVDADSLERADPSSFSGVKLEGDVKLPVGFIVKRGVSAWDISGPTHERKRRLSVHDVLRLTGKYRNSHDERFWETTNGDWVRHRDVTTVLERTNMPSFVHEQRRWIDVSVVMGTAVAYEGQKPVYATLLSVGADRLGDQAGATNVTQRGEFSVVSKHITALNAKPEGFANRVEMHDVPWVLELASGQLLHGAYWHKRFGVEHGPGNLQLSPADARWLWSWAGPSVPEGWHAVLALPNDESATIINVRK